MSKCPDEMQRLQVLSPEPRRAPEFPKCLERSPTRASARHSGLRSGLGTQGRTQHERRSGEQGPQRHMIESSTSARYPNSHLRKIQNFVGFPCTYLGGSQVALMVKTLLASAGDIRDTGSIPGSGRSLGGGHGSPL